MLIIAAQSWAKCNLTKRKHTERQTIAITKG